MDEPRRGDAVGAGHHQIHQDHIGMQQAAAAHCFVAVLGFAH
jgi:hypothetical protein